MQRSQPDGPALEETVLSVPAMACRHCVRTISAQIRDLAGVVAVEADLRSRTLRIQGTLPSGALLSAVIEAGYEAVELSRSAAPNPSPRSPGGHLP